MNGPCLRKLMLPALTLWLAFAITSSAQCPSQPSGPMPACTNPNPPCKAGATCTVTLSQGSGNLTAVDNAVVCAELGATIQWTTSGSDTSWSIMFDNGSSPLLIIWLFQQATISSVEVCHDRRSRRRSASSNPTLPRRKPANGISQLVVGPMDSLVRDAGMKKLMAW